MMPLSKLSSFILLSCFFETSLLEECPANSEANQKWDEKQHSIIDSIAACECCIAVSYVLHSTFESAHKKLPDTVKRLSYADIIDVTEETCDPRKQRFDGYGLTTGKDGSHRLTGPGLAKSSGVAHMGGKTPTRLVDSCNMLLEADETAIYEAWVRGNKMPDGIKEYLCKNPNRQNVPESVSEDLDLAICLKDGIKHVADEL